MPPQHVAAAGAHPADTLVVAGADDPLGGQAEDDRRHPVLMSCGDRKGSQHPSRRNRTFWIRTKPPLLQLFSREIQSEQEYQGNTCALRAAFR